MKPGTALTLRLVGPAIELASVLGLREYWGTGRGPALGLPVKYLFAAGLVLGLCAMVVAGLTLVRRVRPAKRSTFD